MERTAQVFFQFERLQPEIKSLFEGFKIGGLTLTPKPETVLQGRVPDDGSEFENLDQLRAPAGDQNLISKIQALHKQSLNPKPLNTQTLNPKPLTPQALNPKPLNPQALNPQIPHALKPSTLNMVDCGGPDGLFFN